MKYLLSVFILFISVSAIASENNDQSSKFFPVTLNCQRDGKTCVQRVYDALLKAGCAPVDLLSCNSGSKKFESCAYTTRNCSSNRLNAVTGQLECISSFPIQIGVSQLDKTLSSRLERNTVGKIKNGFICSK